MFIIVRYFWPQSLWAVFSQTCVCSIYVELLSVTIWCRRKTSVRPREHELNHSGVMSGPQKATI